MSRKALMRITWILFVTLLLLCGTTYALMYHQTGLLENRLTPANVDCVVHEDFDGTQKTSITVENTGNIEAYIRVRLVSYWVDAQGNIVGKSSEMPEFTPGSNWIAGSNDTYYYASPVASGAFTADNLLGSSMTLEVSDEGFFQVVEVFAEAIQSKPTDAVTNSWLVTLDKDGNITAAP